MRTRRLLFSWIGHADLAAMAASLPDDLRGEVFGGMHLPRPRLGEPGPLKCLLDRETFDEVHLLSNYGGPIDRHYLEWLGGTPTLHAVKLESPIDYDEVFRVADSHLASVVNVPRKDRLDLCMHLSPGTPTMTAIWLLLGKSKYSPTTFFQTHDGKSWVTEVPFDLVVDFVPLVLRDADAKLQALASESPQEVRGFESVAGDSRAIRVAGTSRS
jgi:hypothetical protein